MIMKTIKLLLQGHKTSNEGIFLFLSLCFAISANAQYSDGAPPPPSASYETLPSGYVELGFGFTEPLSSFANNTQSGYGGYALPGDHINISFGIPIEHSNIGIALMYGFYDNAFDINTYVDNVQISDQSTTYSPLIQDSYRENIFMGGLFATIPVDRASFDFRALGGIAICALPEVAYQANATLLAATNNFEWDTYSSISSSFAFDLGAGFRYKFRVCSLMAGIDYLSASPMVNTTQQYTDQYGNTSYTHIGGAISISMMTYSLGIGYEFR
jgi:hypothetical protein